MHSPTTFLEIVGEPRHPAPLDRAALVLIDIQREYLDGVVPLENVQAAANEAGRLLELAREHGVPVFHVAHGSGPGAPVFATDGPYIEHLDPVKPGPGEELVWKTHADAFLGTGLVEKIRATGRDELIIAGDMTHVCVSTSTRSAVEQHGFRVTVVGDATAARDLPDPLGGVVPAETVRRTALAELADAFAVVVKDHTAWL
ncbi:MAG: isochorismatase family protein [Rhizobiaceae bacterium]|nr:isochorismatase family protein [Rhizobiaceae bacterium]